MKIILYSPQIPQNTGNIVRTCKVTGTSLTLVEPLGFSVSDKSLKRAGLDYWLGVNVNIVSSLSDYLETLKGNVYFLSSKATTTYSEIKFHQDDTLVFGNETSGLPPHIIKKFNSNLIRIPMVDGERCLNLATSAGIALYEGLRQQNFSQLK